MDPLVSVICLAYNHEKYIADAIEGFVRQKTRFSFEVIIHDDASTDKTASIIHEYAERYPDIIHPIYQTENQYSKGIKIAKAFIFPYVKGKYIALCEGDDYWCDENKLQKQVDWLENHSDYSACAHNSKVINCENGREYLFNNVYEDQDVSFNDVIKGGIAGRTVFHTSSFMFRSSLREIPDEFQIKGIGDFSRFLYCASQGKIRLFIDVMSVYRAQVKNSWTWRMRHNATPEDREKHWKNVRKMLLNVNEYTKGIHSEAIYKDIRRGDFRILVSKADIEKLRTEYRDLYDKLDFRHKAYIELKHLFPDVVEIGRKIFGRR